MTDIDDEKFGTTGLYPLERWSEFHELIAERARKFLTAYEADDLHDFEQKLDWFLENRANTIGWERVHVQHPRWMSTGQLSDSLLSDAHLFATSFEEGAPLAELKSLLQDIRPIIDTKRKKRAASNEVQAFSVLLVLLAARAARTRDGDAIRKADEILSTYAGTLSMYAWRGASADEYFLTKAANATKGRTTKSDEERRLIRDELARQRGVGERRRDAAKKAATNLIKAHPEKFDADFSDSLVRRCQAILRQDFSDWDRAKSGD